MNADQAATELVELLQRNAVETGRELAAAAEEVRIYAAQRLAHLSTVIAEPGFNRALVAERDNVALKAAGRAINKADAIDARLLGLIEGAMLLGSKALVT